MRRVDQHFQVEPDAQFYGRLDKEERERAGDRVRTDDNNVGNVVLYQLSYARNREVKPRIIFLAYRLASPTQSIALNNFEKASHDC